MYVPEAFATTSDEAQAFVGAADAGDLVAVGPSGLTASFVPYAFDPERGSGGVLLAHLARQNEQWHDLDGAAALMIVRGPDAYVSPGWYASKAEHGRVVPTWNYVTAHVHGRVVVHDAPDFVEDVVRRLTERHEAKRTVPWSVDDAPERYVTGMLRAVVGIELQISRIELKAKLSQNRPAADVEGVVSGLLADGRDDLAELVEDHRS